MNIFQTYNDKIIKLLKTAKENNLLELPENLSGINVEIPPAKFNCDMSTNVAMVLSKPNNKSPLELAKVIADIIKKNDENLDDIKIEKPGFINLKLKLSNAKFCFESNSIKLKDSKYAKSKINGEIKVRENFDRATIIKPSIIFSVDDKLSTRFMSLLSLFPIFPLYYNGETKFTPIHASDVAELIFNIISKEIVSKDIEAIGPEILTFKEIIQILSKCIKKKRLLVPIPLFLAKISAMFFQLFPNPLLTIDQLRLLKYDNIKSENGITNFDIGCPSKLYFEESVLKYSFNYTEGGQFSMKKNVKK